VGEISLSNCDRYVLLKAFKGRKNPAFYRASF
jgi:hypothetical protein